MSNVIQFTIKGVDKFSGTLGKVGSSMARVAKTALKFGTAAAGAATSMFALTNSVAKAQDRVGKLSTRLGISTEALSAFHRQASLSGVSAETMNMALQRMGRRVAEASKGMGEAQKAIKELNLDAKELASLPLDQQMLKVADALQGVESQSDKVRLAFKLFDSEGVALLQTMEKGSEGFREAAREAERLGVIVSAEAAARSAAFVDSFDRLTTSLGGAARAIANSMMPALTEMNERMTDFVANNRDAMVNVFLGLIRAGVTAFVTIESVLSRFAAAWDDFWTNGNLSTIERWGSAFLDAVSSQFMATVKFARVAVESMGRIFISGFKIIGDVIWTSMKFGWDKFMNLIGKGPEVQALGSQLAIAVRDSVQAEMGNIKDAFATITSEVGEMADATGATAAKIFGLDEGSVAAIHARVDGLMNRMQGVGQTLAATPGMAGGPGGGGLATDPAEDPLVQMEMAKQQMITDNIKGHGEMRFEFMRHNLESLTSLVSAQYGQQAGLVASSFGSILTNMGTFSKKAFALQQGLAIVNATIKGYEAITGAYAFGANIGGPPVGAAMAAAAAVATFAQIKNIKSQKFGGAKVAGGAVTAGSSFLVGERGPELFTPNQSGRIANNDELAGAGGGVVVENLNVSILPNATNADALLNMSEEQMERVVAGPIIRAFNNLSRQGIRPEFSERLAV